MSLIFFDMEGPLTPQDNAYEIMGLWPGGRQVFEAISRYDDLLTLEGRPGYEPGDTLSLIVPFLICHGVTSDVIRSLGEKAPLIAGAPALVENLAQRGWQVHAVTTSYAPFACAVAQRVGIDRSQVASTSLPIERLGRWFPEGERLRVAQLEVELVASPRGDDGWLQERLDRFFWQESAHSPLGHILRAVRPIGGSRKVVAVKAYCLAQGKGMGQVVAVGDSITDARLLESVDRAGGLAIAFNANEYSLPWATVGLASTRLDDLLPLLEAWGAGGRPQARAWVEAQGKLPHTDDRADYRWLGGRPPAPEVLALHQRLRRQVRQAAAALG
ncbi:MAG: hypothetical protein HYX99_01125 [Chloroflexi bacterium]|nr:hypothetical protein [Chloroflexota bacterium]